MVKQQISKLQVPATCLRQVERVLLFATHLLFFYFHLKAKVKREAKTSNLFCDIAAKRVEKKICESYHNVKTCFVTNQVVASFVNTDF